MIGNALGQLDAGGIRHGPRPDLGQRKGRVVRGQDQVARQRQFQPTAAADAIHRRDHRLVQVRQLLQAAETAHAVVAVDRIARGRRLQIPAGAEEFLPLGTKDRHAQAIVIAERPKHLPHDPACREVDRIGLGAVQRDFEDRTLAPRP